MLPLERTGDSIALIVAQAAGKEREATGAAVRVAETERMAALIMAGDTDCALCRSR